MWINNRYVATRDPSRGGLYISATTEGFSPEHKEEIYDHCLELITKDDAHICTGIYPLNNGQYSIGMGCRVRGSRKESRPHEVIRGAVADPEELLEICEKYMGEGVLQDIFFPCAPNPDKPEAWTIAGGIRGTVKGCFQQFWKEMDYRDILNFFNAMKVMKKKQFKVQLIVPEGMSRIVLAACCSMAVQAGVRMFIMADGECTLTMPDLLITDKLLYLDEGGYQRMTLEAFIHMGAHMDREGDDAEEIEGLLNFCKDYLISGEISDYELYQKADALMARDMTIYSGFRTGLRSMLQRCCGIDRYMNRYMKLLYIAFKMEGRREQKHSAALCTAPYDFGGMYVFLKKKARSGREYRRLVRAMVETQFMECGDPSAERAVHEAGRSWSEKL